MGVDVGGLGGLRGKRSWERRGWRFKEGREEDSC